MLGARSSFGSAFAEKDGPHDISLNLTALMDILSNLLFFLLASYSAQEMEIKQKQGLELPASTSESKVVVNLVVTVSKHQILVAEVPVAGLQNGKVTDSPEDGDKIVNLYERLKNVQSTRQAAGREGLPGDDTILLLADKETDSALVTRVLKTAAMAGFANVRFGVLAK